MDSNIRTDLSELNQSAKEIKAQLSKVIVGQQAVIEMLLTALFSNGHVLLEGVPGVAKTLIANLLAKTIDIRFTRIQFTPDLMPGDLIGTSVFRPDTTQFEFRKGPLFSNLVLIDEINRSPAKTQSALFEVMEEKQITYDGNTYEMNEPFMVLATQNPIEQEGTYRLPEAQLDRFVFKLIVNYPSAIEEVEILKVHHQNIEMQKPVTMINSVLQATQIIAYRKHIRQLHVEEKLLEYMAQIVIQTRNNKSIFLGASPRASVSILQTSKAYAALNGRDFVTPEDIQQVVPHVLRHRIILTPEKEMEGITTDEVIKQIIQKIEIPR